MAVIQSPESQSTNVDANNVNLAAVLQITAPPPVTLPPAAAPPIPPVTIQPVPASSVSVPPPAAQPFSAPAEMLPTNGISSYNGNSGDSSSNGISSYHGDSGDSSNNSSSSNSSNSNSGAPETSYRSDVSESSDVAGLSENANKRLKTGHNKESVEKIDESNASYANETGQITPDSEGESVKRQPYESDDAVELISNDDAGIDYDRQSCMSGSTTTTDQAHGDQEDHASGWEFQDDPHESWTLVNAPSTRRLEDVLPKLVDPSSSLPLMNENARAVVERLTEKMSKDDDMKFVILRYEDAVGELGNERSKRQEGEKAVRNLNPRLHEAQAEIEYLKREISHLRAKHEDKLPMPVEVTRLYEQISQLKSEHQAELLKGRWENYSLKQRFDQALFAEYNVRDDIIRSAQMESRKLEGLNRQTYQEKLALENQIVSLKDEAAKYQLLLGNATNLRWGDNDSNNSVQLRKDITKLQNLLSDFVISKKGVELKEDAARELLKSYKCHSEISAKPIFAAALQRRTIELVLQKATEFLIASAKGKPTDDASDLEARIGHSVGLLVSQLNEFSQTRKGSDNVTSVTPIKVRQQVYAVLGNRSFATANPHPLISHVCTELLADLDQYRTLKSPLRVKNVTSMAPEIVHEIVRMFLFRFMAQEPPISYHWYESDDLTSKSTMQGPEMDDDDDDDDDSDEDGGQEQVKVVEICSFPLIGVDLEDATKRQIITPAKVHTRPAPKPSDEAQEKSPSKIQRISQRILTVFN